MHNGNVRVGVPSPAGKPGQPSLAEPAGEQVPGGSHVEPQQALNRPRSNSCGAMTQQRGSSDHFSAPQGLVQLVGCRDPKKLAEALAEPFFRGAAKR